MSEYLTPEDRDRLRELADEYDDSTIDGCPDMAAGTIRQLLEALDQAEADRDWLFRSSRLAKEGRIKANARADQAEARIKAVRELCDTAPNGEDLDPLSSHYSSGYELALQDIRRALDGEQ